MRLVPACTWQVRHWLVGITLRRRCSTGWPAAISAMRGAGSSAAVPRLQHGANAPDVTAVAGALVRHRAVVVEGGAPEHAARGHHRLAVLLDFFRVTAAQPATDMRNP